MIGALALELDDDRDHRTVERTLFAGREIQEFREWTEVYHRAGVDALKVNRKGLESEYRAEVKRLQAKIGKLVMENEIRKEAMRPFTSVEPMFPGSLLDDDGQKP